MLRIAKRRQFLHVPYKGSSPAIVDLLAGHVDMNFDALSSITAYLKSGQMRPLAVTTPQRDPGPARGADHGRARASRSLKITNWYGVMAPAGTPPDVLQTLHDEIYRILQLPDVDAEARRARRAPPADVDRASSRNSSAPRTESYREIAKMTGVRID